MDTWSTTKAAAGAAANGEMIWQKSATAAEMQSTDASDRDTSPLAPSPAKNTFANADMPADGIGRTSMADTCSDDNSCSGSDASKGETELKQLLTTARVTSSAAEDDERRGRWYRLNSAEDDEMDGTGAAMADDDDQPLDLSSKSSAITAISPLPTNNVVTFVQELPSPITSLLPNSSMRVPMLNTNRHIFKAKPRLSPNTSRRTYTEEELQAALKDIQSGKLGTRRAAVMYGIPRSTLRNKVYKLALEKERDPALLFSGAELADERNAEEGDANTIEEDYKREDEEDERSKDYQNLKEDQSGNEEEKEESDSGSSKRLLSVEDIISLSRQSASSASLRDLLQHGSKYFAGGETGKVSTSPAPVLPMPPPLYSMFPPGMSEMWGNPDSPVAPYLAHLMAAAARENINASAIFAGLNPFAAATSKRDQSPDVGAKSSAFNASKFSPPIFPELVQRMILEERILMEEQRKREILNSIKNSAAQKSPNATYAGPAKLAPTLSNFSTKNGRNPNAEEPSTTTYNIEKYQNELDSERNCSSPRRGGDTSESPSPPSLMSTIKDSLTNNQRFARNIPEGFRFQPNVLYNNVSLNAIPPEAERRHWTNRNDIPSTSTNSTSNNNSGGKGTRPKRGKYRNYDRDSLVEAVRAVQRGEMSVHRAGSYYGVPHSTLEYKVKERHLMRPRKREPKSAGEQTRDENFPLRISSTSDSGNNSTLKKMPFTPQMPNGIKMPQFFDPTAAFPPGSFHFWPPNPFQQLSMEYQPNPGFSHPNAEQIAKHLNRLHEENKNSPLSQPNSPPANTLGKSTREVAEKLYDGSPNGSFLDGIIRSSLEKGVQIQNENNAASASSAGASEVSRTNLIEQLYRNKILAATLQNKIEEERKNGNAENKNFNAPGNIESFGVPAKMENYRTLLPENFSAVKTENFGNALLKKENLSFNNSEIFGNLRTGMPFSFRESKNTEGIRSSSNSPEEASVSAAGIDLTKYETNNAGRHIQPNQGQTPLDQRETSPNQRQTPPNQRQTPPNQRQTPPYQRQTPPKYFFESFSTNRNLTENNDEKILFNHSEKEFVN